MLVQSEGIVLKSIKYGETSLICSVFFRTYGLKSVIVKGVRSYKNNKLKSNIFQPGNILNIEFYNTPLKNLQLIKEANLCYAYTNIREDITKSCIQIFMLEVILQILEQDFPQEELYDFIAELFKIIDQQELYNALIPCYFLLYINKLSGYHIYNNQSAANPYFNIWEGNFQPLMPELPPYLDEIASKVLSELNNINDINEISTINHFHKQHEILSGLLVYMEHHYPNFKPLKSLSILSTILS